MSTDCVIKKFFPWFNYAHATNTDVQKLCLQPHKWSPIPVFQDSKSAELQFNSKLGHHNNRSKQNWLEQQFTERKFTQSPVITMYNFWSKLSLTQFISRPYVCRYLGIPALSKRIQKFWHAKKMIIHSKSQPKPSLKSYCWIFMKNIFLCRTINFLIVDSKVSVTQHFFGCTLWDEGLAACCSCLHLWHQTWQTIFSHVFLNLLAEIERQLLHKTLNEYPAGCWFFIILLSSRRWDA